MTSVRSYLAIALALVLLLTAQSMAVARGAPEVAGQMVLCSGSGPVTVYMDTEGQPTAAPHICPECALSFFGILDPQILVILAPLQPVAAPWPSQVGWRDILVTLETSARGPPLRL